jgi:hypothetical protein
MNPLTTIYGRVTALRNALFDRGRSPRGGSNHP